MVGKIIASVSKFYAVCFPYFTLSKHFLIASLPVFSSQVMVHVYKKGSPSTLFLVFHEFTLGVFFPHNSVHVHGRFLIKMSRWRDVPLHFFASLHHLARFEPPQRPIKRWPE